MPRSRTTADPFCALAEPRRRQIVDALARASSGLGVSAIVAIIGLSQPSVSKHLGVLREVGIVEVERDGPNRIYHLRPERLKAMHDWLSQYERLWTHQLSRIRERAERMQHAATPPGRHTS
ncbi:MAG: helix-turn-helix transcriptional regulator [Phycisphaeraceae bacterium]|nr:helix-turn-helix transcriptional regulator [Phycisphaeraceae bacterium]